MKMVIKFEFLQNSLQQFYPNIATIADSGRGRQSIEGAN